MVVRCKSGAESIRIAIDAREHEAYEPRSRELCSAKVTGPSTRKRSERWAWPPIRLPVPGGLCHEEKQAASSDADLETTSWCAGQECASHVDRHRWYPVQGILSIVGVGASAGGLEAFTELLEDLPSDTGMAFVLIQHLDPTHQSFLADALAKAPYARQPGGRGRAGESEPRVRDPARLRISAMLHGQLGLLPRPTEARKPHLPIDSSFGALAEERGAERSRVILSGTRIGWHRWAAGDQGGRRHHLCPGAPSRRSSAACPAAPSTPASSTIACRFPSSRASSLG